MLVSFFFFNFDIATTHIYLLNCLCCQMNISYIYILFCFPGWLPVMPPLYHTTSSISFALVPIKKLYLKRYSHESFDLSIPFKIFFFLSNPTKLYTVVIPCIAVCCVIFISCLSFSHKHQNSS
jgi:hypothetical protein